MIKKISEFDCIFKKKQSVGNKYFSIFYDFHDLEHFKYAISIGKKYGKAHERNLMKRRLRHIVYDLVEKIDSKLMFVIVVKPNACNLTFEMIEKDLKYLLDKLIRIRKG